MDFLNFCYFDCKLKKRGCMNTCQIRVETRKRHPDWFGAWKRWGIGVFVFRWGGSWRKERWTGQGENRMVRKHRQPVIQNHHISYNPEVKVQVFKGEHQILTLIQRRKRFSKGFLLALTSEMKRIETSAVDLSNPTFLKVKPWSLLIAAWKHACCSVNSAWLRGNWKTRFNCQLWNGTFWCEKKRRLKRY